MAANSSSTHPGDAFEAPPFVDLYRPRALLVGAAALVLASVVSFVAGGAVHFFRAYLVGFIFCTGLGVGSLAWLMLQHLTGGGWGLVTRRLFEAATRTIPLLFLMFIPVAVSLFVHPHGHSLYEWSNHDVVARDPVLQHKRPYLNEWFFIVRGVFYFAVWFALAHFLNKWSAEQDRTGDPRVRRKMQEISGPGILLFGLTVTFAAVDWGMSLEPHWFSTIYGLIIMVGWGLSALAFAIAAAVTLSRHEPLRDAYGPGHLSDLGKLLLTMVMLFAYFSFSQFLIIWSGNLPEETPFYIRRLRGGWEYVALLLILFHFALPFVLLISRRLKRAGRTLRRVAFLMLFMRVVDLVFLIAPAAHVEGHEAGSMHVAEFAVNFLTMFGMAAGLGGLWLWLYLGQLRARPLLPVGAPDLERALEPAPAHH